MFSRLYFFLISNNLVNCVKCVEIKAGYKSDHLTADIKFDFSKINKGPGYFKLNNSLLLDKDYQNLIKQYS